MRLFGLLLFFSTWACYAENCCRFQGGVAGCNKTSGEVMCFNGDVSLKCSCQKENKITSNDPLPSNSHIIKGKRVWRCNEGYYQTQKKECIKFKKKCEPGFELKNDICMKSGMPKNARYVGNKWECNEGFVQRRNECVKLNIPQYAKMNLDGHTWTCMRGFKKYRNRCKKIKLPKNSMLNEEGNDWTCKKGFKRIKGKCK